MNLFQLKYCVQFPTYHLFIHIFKFITNYKDYLLENSSNENNIFPSLYINKPLNDFVQFFTIIDFLPKNITKYIPFLKQIRQNGDISSNKLIYFQIAQIYGHK